MPGVPAYCDACRKTFISNAIWIENSFDITLGGGTVDCPKGHTARIIDGTFDLSETPFLLRRHRRERWPSWQPCKKHLERHSQGKAKRRSLIS